MSSVRAPPAGTSSLFGRSRPARGGPFAGEEGEARAVRRRVARQASHRPPAASAEPAASARLMAGSTTSVWMGLGVVRCTESGSLESRAGWSPARRRPPPGARRARRARGRLAEVRRERFVGRGLAARGPGGSPRMEPSPFARGRSRESSVGGGPRRLSSGCDPPSPRVQRLAACAAGGFRPVQTTGVWASAAVRQWWGTPEMCICAAGAPPEEGDVSRETSSLRPSVSSPQHANQPRPLRSRTDVGLHASGTERHAQDRPGARLRGSAAGWRAARGAGRSRRAR